MAYLNYHHLRLFRAIAHERSIARAAAQLNLSQSALSTQLRSLEAQLGQALFERRNRRLDLTEAGQIALDYADTIFETGDELVGTLQGRHGSSRQRLRVGAIATLSRNFQTEFLRPLARRDDVELAVRSGSFRELLALLNTHALDVVLSNRPAPRDGDNQWTSRLLDEQAVSLVGRKGAGGRFRFPDSLRTTPVILPSSESDLRHGFDALMERAGIRPTILAEVDDMAMLRLLALETPGVALVPLVVVEDELRRGLLSVRCKIPRLRESFYAVTQDRRFPNPVLGPVLAAWTARSPRRRAGARTPAPRR
jgi:LysR family transcriptional activator of nhaA